MAPEAAGALRGLRSLARLLPPLGLQGAVRGHGEGAVVGGVVLQAIGSSKDSIRVCLLKA